MKENKKLYIVRKYVMARSAQEALKLSRKIRPDDVWVDDKWREQKERNLEACIGFEVGQPEEE